MSLELSHSTPLVEIRTSGLDDVVSLGDYDIPLADFLEAAYYVLTNTHLTKDDPRVAFVAEVGRLTEIDGYRPGLSRLGGVE